MKADAPFGANDWDTVALVVFDVDGTLYDQRALRLRMARELLRHAAWRYDLQVAAVLRRYRRLREQFGREERPGFESLLIAATAAASGCAAPQVQAIVDEWLLRRPLPFLARCRYPGLTDLFAGLQRSGRTVGVLSDYPAAAKLRALGLDADLIVSATDADVQALKPHPQGLQCLMERAGTGAAHTLVIGDRVDCDGQVARRVGARCLIRSATRAAGWQTFARFDEPLFAPVLGH